MLKPVRAGRLAALALAAAAASRLACAAPQSLESVSLQLKWRHQFQFAGYYMAAEKGYYRDAGLEVRIREAGPDTRFTDEVAEGRADFGINNTDLLIDRVKGKKVVVLAVVFQHSPLILLSLAKSRLSSPEDFIGKRVMVSLDAEAEIFSMFSNESIQKDAVRYLQHSWDIEDLVSGKVDAVSAYSTNEPLGLKARGITYNMARPLTYGIDFYGDCLFTSEAEIRAHPARTAAFLAASLRGWEYALDNPGEACDLILSKYSQAKDKASLLAEAAAMDELIVHEFVPLGSINPGRWRHIGDTYAKLGAIPSDYSLAGFLYDPKAPVIDPRVLKIVIAALAAAMAVAIGYILILRAFNARLGVEVASRTAVLEENSRALSRSLGEKEVLLKEVHHRVKNNLQVIASIINMQIEDSSGTGSPEALLTLKNRVFGMALAHERIYGSESLARVDMDDYLGALVAELVLAYRRTGLIVEARAEAPGIGLAVEIAMPLGLVVGELVTNSLKHAFEGRESGRIEVRLRREGSRFELLVSDDGSGPSPGAGSGIGLRLAEALASQLGGELRRIAGHGAGGDAAGLSYLLSFETPA